MVHETLICTTFISYCSRFTNCFKITQWTRKIFRIKLMQATLKHARTIVVAEPSHGPLKCFLRVYEKQFRHDWHKHIDLALLQHNTSYHKNIGGRPTLLFHGGFPMNTIDIGINNRTLYHHCRKWDYISHLQSKMTTLSGKQQNLSWNILTNLKKNYDRKAAAESLKLHEHFVTWNLKQLNYHEKIRILQRKEMGYINLKKFFREANT